MYISVKYKTSDTPTFSERSYTYKTELPAKLGDHVIAPTPKNLLQEALVVGVNMPEPPFDCKSIVEFAPGWNPMAEINFAVETDLAPISSTIIVANYEETEKQLRELMTPYASLVVTEDTVSSAKSDLARIRKVHKSIDDYRKSIKKAFTAPVTAFESKVKALTGVCEEAESNLDGQIKTFEERRKREKIDALAQFFGEVAEDVRGYLTFPQILNPRWENATFPIEEAEEEIRTKVAECWDGINAIRDLQSPFEATLLSDFKQTQNLAACLKKHKELAEIQRKEDERRAAEQKAKEEADAIRKAREEAAIKARQESEARAKAEAQRKAEEEAVESQVSAPPSERLYTLSFRVTATRQQLMALKDAFTAIGISYQRIEG